MISVNGNNVEIVRFPDGTKKIRSTDKPEGRDHSEVVWKYDDDSEFFAVISTIEHLRETRHRPVRLVMPYLPNARMDRVVDGTEVFTLKHFAKAINNTMCESVTVFDPHSNVGVALLDRVIVDTPKRYILRTIDDIKSQFGVQNLLIFYPDEGAMKRYSGMIDLPYAFSSKKRDWVTGKILGLDVHGMTDLIQGQDILIVDDICSRGGTFYHSAKKLKELGANRIFLYVSHCENVVEDGEMLGSGLVEKVFTTDSILRINNEKIEVYHYEQNKSDAAD